MTHSDDDSRILMIGAVLGDDDPDSMQWSGEINELSRECTAATVGLKTPLRLNVIYFVDGRLRLNEFDDVRTGRHFRTKNLLVVQVAISKSWAGSRRSLLLERLGEAIDEAEAFAVKRRIASDLSAMRDVLSNLRDRRMLD